MPLLLFGARTGASPPGPGATGSFTAHRMLLSKQTFTPELQVSRKHHQLTVGPPRCSSQEGRWGRALPWGHSAGPRSRAEPWQGLAGGGDASHRMRWSSPAHRVWPGLRAGWAEAQTARPAWLGDRRAQPGVREAGIWLPPPPKHVLSSWPVGTLPQQRRSRQNPAGVGERRVDYQGS